VGGFLPLDLLFNARHTARLLSHLKSDEAEHAWRVLVEHNPDCYEYYRGYLSNLGIQLGTFVPSRCPIWYA
jgi:hypothetical protein